MLLIYSICEIQFEKQRVESLCPVLILFSCRTIFSIRIKVKNPPEPLLVHRALNQRFSCWVFFTGTNRKLVAQPCCGGNRTQSPVLLSRGRIYELTIFLDQLKIQSLILFWKFIYLFGAIIRGKALVLPIVKAVRLQFYFIFILFIFIYYLFS